MIFNPVAGWRRRSRFLAVIGALRDCNCDITIRQTAHAGHARELAATVDPQQFDVLAIAGGDGTINEAINGLALAAHRAPPMALIPLGTANVLAMELGLSLEPGEIARTIAGGATREIHLGQVDGHRFAMMAGVGFDAHVVAGVDSRIKRMLHKGAYALETLRQFLRFRFPRYQVSVDGREAAVSSLIAANGHYYAGRFVVAPGAALHRAGLEAVMFQGRGRLHAVKYAIAMVLGLLTRLNDVAIESFRTLEVSGPAGEPVQADGDIVARLPVTIALAKERLSVVVPD